MIFEIVLAKEETLVVPWAATGQRGDRAGSGIEDFVEAVIVEYGVKRGEAAVVRQAAAV